MHPNLIFDTKHWMVFLGDDQTYFGRIMVELKRKCGSLSEITEEELLDFLELVRKYEAMMKERFNATLFNWTCLMNHAYQTKPYKPQLHWHCRPRYDHEVEFEGETFTDLDFGEHYDRKLVREVSEELKKKIIAAIKP